MRLSSARSAFLIAVGACIAAAIAALGACAGGRDEMASIWTDEPGIALAAELFNARGGPEAVRLEWKREPAGALLEAEASGPALVVGRSLGGWGLRERLSALDSILRRRPDRDAFYPELLDGGRIGGRLVLLPISFNLPAIVFLRDSPAPGDGFTLSLSDIAAPSVAFRNSQGSVARMGFSPRWDERFFVEALDSLGARFREAAGTSRGRPELAWDPVGLRSALGELGAWSTLANGSAALEDDYRFKYLYAPPYRWLKEGRALYAYMDSSELFLASEEIRTGLDFRWYSSGGTVPVSEGAVYAGLVRGAKGRPAAEAFLRWLLTPEAQRAVLERSRATGVSSYSFGIAGGFSSIRSVNEGVFPTYYPALVGHAPPADKLAAPERLPPDWPSLRAEAVAPWALDASALAAARADGSSQEDPSSELSERISDYSKRGAKR
jgi:hypothetical protein